MDERGLNVLLVEDDQVDVMNVQRAFKKNNIGNPLWVAPEDDGAACGVPPPHAAEANATIAARVIPRNLLGWVAMSASFRAKDDHS